MSDARDLPRWRRDAELMILKARKINLPSFSDSEIVNCKKLLGRKKFKDVELTEEQFTQVVEAIDILDAKSTDIKFSILTSYVNIFRPLLHNIDLNKCRKQYYSVDTILPIVRSEMLRFVSRYDFLIKKSDDDSDNYTPLGLGDKQGGKHED